MQRGYSGSGDGANMGRPPRRASGSPPPRRIRDPWEDDDPRDGWQFRTMAELEIALAEVGYKRDWRDHVMADSRLRRRLELRRQKIRTMVCAYCEMDLTYFHGRWWHVWDDGFAKECEHEVTAL